MISFFRTIHQKLLQQNRVTRYLFYALGEIFLVVIGILIALQVNNWNEDRKEKIYERKMLLELIEDMQLDTAFMHLQLRRIEVFERSLDALEKSLSSWDDLKDEDPQLFGGVYFIQNTKALETIKSGNIQIPFNDQLRKQINSHYHNSRFYLDLIIVEDKNFNDFRAIPIQKEYFKVERNEDSEIFDLKISPLDFEKMNQSQEFKDFLLLRRGRVNRWNWAYRKVYDSTLESMKSIQEYLQQKTN